MKLIEYMTGPMQSYLAPALAAGVAIALIGGLLSMFVVLKRLSFVGQGVSHSAFGGVGVAAAVGWLTGLGASMGFVYGVVCLFCVTAAVGIAWVSERRREHEDTVIGVFLVGAMALGALLIHLANRGGSGFRLSWESLLFGSILGVDWGHAALAFAVLLLIAAALWSARRSLIFWAFDEPAATAFGAPSTAMRYLLMILLAIAVLASMRLAGVILATALLILPGATALHLSSRLSRVVALSVFFSVVGVLGGFVIALEFDLPPGAAMVLTLILLYAATWPIGRASQRSADSGGVA